MKPLSFTPKPLQVNLSTQRKIDRAVADEITKSQEATIRHLTRELNDLVTNINKTFRELSERIRELEEASQDAH